MKLILTLLLTVEKKFTAYNVTVAMPIIGDVRWLWRKLVTAIARLTFF